MEEVQKSKIYSDVILVLPKALQTDKEREGLPFQIPQSGGGREHVRCGDLEWSGVDEKALTCCLSVAPHKKRGLHSLISLSKYSISK